MATTVCDLRLKAWLRPSFILNVTDSLIMRSQIFYLIPSKFLALLAHLAMLIIALHGKDALIRGSMPPDEEDEDEYSKLNTLLMVGLILAICMVAIEITVFLSGLTFFMLFLSTFEMISHIGATITLAMCILENWHIDSFWWIFWIGSVVPFSLEIIASIRHIIQNI